MDKRAQSLGLGWARKAHSFHTLLASFCPRPRTQTRRGTPKMQSGIPCRGRRRRGRALSPLPFSVTHPQAV